MIGHWSRFCRTSKHLVELYHASLGKKKRKNIEANGAYQDNDIFNPSNMRSIQHDNLDVTDLFEIPEEKIDIIGETISVSFDFKTI